MAIKLHGVVLSPPVQRVLACLIEKGLDYEFIVVNMAGGDHKKPNFLSINPFGQIPALEDGDLKLFESRAITRYIAFNYADKGTQLVLKEPKEMAVMAVGMEVEVHQFDVPAMKLVRELYYKPFFMKTETDEAVVEEQEVVLGKVLDLYEARLSNCNYLSGDTFTLTDLHHLPVLECLMASRVKAVINARPCVSAWCATIMARPAWQKVVALKNNQ